ncbi:MAG: ribonuclease HI [Bdellovibrionales bacterium]|nr:ribonuclease HI [Bdellovibrionales bacterium]
MIWKQLSCIKTVFSKSPLSIYTDGSQKKGLGTWSYIIVQDNKIIAESSGKEKEFDCTRMEFRAAIEAMNAMPQNSKFTLGTDSKILVDTMTSEIKKWTANNWRKPNGKSIPNLDLIQELDSLNQKHFIHWKWIRGHAGNIYNERCDELCRQART